MTQSTTDHLEDLPTYRDSLYSELEQAPLDDLDDATEWFDAWCLEVELSYYQTANTDTLWREETRFLLSFGGPTVRLTYSHRYDTATLYHSWGSLNGQPCTQLEISPHLVRRLVETFTPEDLYGWAR